VQLQLATVRVGELAKRLLVPLARACERPLDHDGILAQDLPFKGIVRNNTVGVRKSSVSSSQRLCLNE
jgi:hypothetical protein